MPHRQTDPPPPAPLRSPRRSAPPPHLQNPLRLKDRASNRITIGCIGLGMEGMHKDLRNMLAQDDTQVLAVCDVDRSRLATGDQAVESHYAKSSSNGDYKGVTSYNDFRDLLARNDIDAVVVATPDHWHVPISILAVRAGKDVYCEKPLTRTIAEGRQLADEVERYARVFQTASEFRATPTFHRAAELVRNGRLGKLRTIRTGLPSGNNVLGTPPRQHTDPPKDLDYDMWLGPAPLAPYFEGRCHFNFRWLLDYSGGHITDWGCHLNDIAQWANNTDHTGPTEIRATGEFPKDRPLQHPHQIQHRIHLPQRRKTDLFGWQPWHPLRRLGRPNPHRLRRQTAIHPRQPRTRNHQTPTKPTSTPPPANTATSSTASKPENPATTPPKQATAPPPSATSASSPSSPAAP